MTEDQEGMTGELYSELYELSQKATREALKKYDLSDIDRGDLILETKKNKKSLVYKLFVDEGISKTLIATTTVKIESKNTTVKVSNLNERD